jgi:protein TonB
VGADDRVGSAADSVAGAHVPAYAKGGRTVRPAAKGDSVFVEVPPEAVGKVPPKYPTQARVDGVSGTVIVFALISAEGRVADAFVHESIPELDFAAMEAVRRWKFKPASMAGKPLAVWVAIPVEFTLK